MKKGIHAIALAMAMLAGGAAAHAGVQHTWPLIVTKNSDGTGSASGGVAATRDDGNPLSEISCVHSTSIPGGITTCTLVDAQGHYAYVWTTDPLTQSVLHTIGESGFLSVTWGVGGKLTGATVTVGSAHAVKSH
jgi:hypothetical protein